jgi:hypothetical protein
VPSPENPTLAQSDLNIGEIVPALWIVDLMRFIDIRLREGHNNAPRVRNSG